MNYMDNILNTIGDFFMDLLEFAFGLHRTIKSFNGWD